MPFSSRDYTPDNRTTLYDLWNESGTKNFYVEEDDNEFFGVKIERFYSGEPFGKNAIVKQYRYVTGAEPRIPNLRVVVQLA